MMWVIYSNSCYMNLWAVLWDMMCVIGSRSCSMNVVWFASGIITSEHFITCDLIHVGQLILKNCVMLKKWIIQEIGTFGAFISTIFILNKIQGMVFNPLNSKGNYS